MRVRSVVVVVALVVAGCGGTDADTAAPPAPVNSSAAVGTSAPSVPPTSLFETYLGLQCSFEAESATYTFEEGASGFATVEEAVDDWLANDEGRSVVSAYGEVLASVDIGGRVELLDGDGVLRVVLSATDLGDGWLIESTERCVGP